MTTKTELKKQAYEEYEKEELALMDAHTSRAIVTASTRELTPQIWKMIETLAPTMYRARMFGVTSPEQAAAIILKGYELGLSVTASFEFVQVIQGKPALSPRGAMALLLSSPIVTNIEINRLENGGKFAGYSCTMTRSTGFTYTASFTLDDAKRAQLVKPDSGWDKYPENMCLWRAVGFAADVVAPDVTAGMTTLMKAPEAYGVALTEGGDVVDVTPATVPDLDPLTQLVNQYGADKVLAIWGRIPAVNEVELARIKLEENSTQ